MSNPRKLAFEKTAETIIKNLEKRGMEGYFCKDCEQAVQLVKSFIDDGESIGWGGSSTFAESGVRDALEQGNYIMFDRARAKDAMEAEEIYHSHFNCETYFMSTNAITIKGELVNIDGNSNRLACLLYGPEQVILLVGMNKVVSNVEAGIERIRTLACPPNAARLHCVTPCEKYGVCGKCQGEQSMCCNIVITRSNQHAGRIKVVLIAEDLGY